MPAATTTTAAAMREAVKQGFYPGGVTPYGFCKVPVEVRAGKKPRYKLAIDRAERVLTGLARCGLCGSSYQLDPSGKSLDGSTYSYCYYNCRKTLRAGKKACPGFRLRVEDLDGKVLAAIADLACTPERVGRLARRHDWPPKLAMVVALQ